MEKKLQEIGIILNDFQNTSEHFWNDQMTVELLEKIRMVMGWELPKPESKKYIMMPTMVKRLCRSCFGWSYHGRKMGCNECADTGYVMRKEVEKIYIEEE